MCSRAMLFEHTLSVRHSLKDPCLAAARIKRDGDSTALRIRVNGFFHLFAPKPHFFHRGGNVAISHYAVQRTEFSFLQGR